MGKIMMTSALPYMFTALTLCGLITGCDLTSDVVVSSVATIVNEGASNPTVAIDGQSGRRYVAWVGTLDEVSNVYLASARAGDSVYTAPVRVNGTAGDAAPHEQAPAQVVAGPEGNVYVVWQNNQPVPGRAYPGSDIRFARSTDYGVTWGATISVNDDADGPLSSHTFHDVEVAPDGTIYVSWIDSRIRDRLEAAGGAEPMEMGDDDRPDPDIRVASSGDGGRSFGSSVVVDSGACPCCRTALAVGPDGTVYVAWRKIFEGSVRDVVVARAAPGDLDFSSAVRVHDDDWVFNACPHAGPGLAVDDDGRVHIAWYTGVEGRQGLWYAESDSTGAAFGDPVALMTDAWVPPSQVKLVADANEMWIAWDDRREAEKRVVLARAGTGDPRIVENAAITGASPALAATRGTILIAWQDGEAVRSHRIHKETKR